MLFNRKTTQNEFNWNKELNRPQSPSFCESLSGFFKMYPRKDVEKEGNFRDRFGLVCSWNSGGERQKETQQESSSNTWFEFSGRQNSLYMPGHTDALSSLKARHHDLQLWIVPTAVTLGHAQDINQQFTAHKNWDTNNHNHDLYT